MIVPNALGDGDGNPVGNGEVAVAEEGEVVVLAGEVTMLVNAWRGAEADAEDEFIVLTIPKKVLRDASA